MGSKERRIREKEWRRKQIQEAAGRLFINKGYNSTTLEEIADMVELTPGAIYRHFKNKEELFTSLLMIPMKNLYNQTKKIYNNHTLDVEDKIIKIKESFFNVIQEDQLMIRTTFHLQLGDSLSTINHELLGDINDLTQKTLKFLADVFDEGVSQGKFVPRKGAIYADMFWGIITGIFMYEEAKKKINPSKDFLKETIDQAFDIFFSGAKLKS